MILKEQYKPHIIIIGNEPMLVYLLGRYCEQLGCSHSGQETSLEVSRNHPQELVIYTAIHYFESNLQRVNQFIQAEIPVIVCSSETEEAHAKELGVDMCLVHPITFEKFEEAITSLSQHSYYHPV